jgi:tyrosinase
MVVSQKRNGTEFAFLVHPGQNNLRRRSSESTVKIPFERTFRNLDDGPADEGSARELFNFCGCGW